MRYANLCRGVLAGMLILSAASAFAQDRNPASFVPGLVMTLASSIANTVTDRVIETTSPIA
jgi:hypothetical protein